MRQHNLRILFFLLVLWGVAVACSRREARFRIGVSQCSEDEWRRQMNSEILREAHFYEDVEVDIRTAVDDNDRQAKDIRELIAEGVDLLIVAPNEATPITPVVEEAYNRGIPVIVVDRKILSDKYTAYVGADNYEIGKAVAGRCGGNLRFGGLHTCRRPSSGICEGYIRLSRYPVAGR